MPRAAGGFVAALSTAPDGSGGALFAVTLPPGAPDAACTRLCDVLPPGAPRVCLNDGACG